MILHFSASMLTLVLVYYVCEHLYVLDLSMFIQKDKKGREKKSPLKQVFLKRNDILDRPLDCVIFLKLVRVDYYLFFRVFLGIDLGCFLI